MRSPGRVSRHGFMAMVGLILLMVLVSPHATAEEVFMVKFPKTFPVPTRMLEADGVGGRYVTSKDRGAQVCMVAWNRIPDAVLKKKTAEQILNDAAKGGVGQFEKLLERVTPISLQGHPGRYIERQSLQNGMDVFFVDKVIYKKPRLYQVVYIGTRKADMRAPEVQHFLESFRFKP